MIVDLPDTTTSKVSKKIMALREQGGVIALGRVLTLVVVTRSGLEEEAIAAANEASREHPCRIIVLADATPTEYVNGYPVDLFGNIAAFVRGAQIPPGESQSWDGCATASGEFSSPTTEERIAGTVPSWFVGLGLQVVLAALLVWRAWARTRTPARRMPPGTRVA